MSNQDDPVGMSPFSAGPGRPRDWPLPFTWQNADGTTIEFSGEDIAMYVHCGCGMPPLSFVRWLLAELETLGAEES